MASREETARGLSAHGDDSVGSTATGFKVRGLRWWIVGLVFLATVINYIDRQTTSVLASVITKDLNLTNTDYGDVASWFLLAYTAGMAFWGRMVDRFGVKLTFTICIVIWSLAAGVHAWAAGFLSLAIMRAVLGFGEAGNWPGAAKGIAEWFPARERALGMAIFNSGVTLGGIIAPPVLVHMQDTYGWRVTFLGTGALGFIWLVAWLLIYKTPEKHPWLTKAEYDVIRGTETPTNTKTAPKAKSLGYGKLLGYRQVWAIVLARFCTDPIWWLYVIWLPKYLNDARGLNLKTMSWANSAIFACAGIGAITGGWLSGHLIKRGWSVDKARRTALLIGAAMLPAGAFAATAQSVSTAIVLICIATFAFQFWMNNVQALPGDFFPSSMVGSVFGLGGVAAGLASFTFIKLSGRIVDHFSYTPMFIVAGILGPLGLLLLFMTAGKIRRVEIKETTT